MSFRDIESRSSGAGHRGQPKQRRDSESSFERAIKSNIQEMQDEIRTANDLLERAERCGLSRRMRDGVDRCMSRGRELSQRTELQFREWTVHFAGEPMERHRKKPSYEKLQRAFEDELMHLKGVASRAAVAQETNTQGQRTSECMPMCEAQEPSIDMGIEEDQGLLCNFDSQQLAREEEDIQARIVAEREEGIRRIQSQTQEVNQMFRDLAAVVTEQGQHLETIDQQAEVSSQVTKETIHELKKTAKRQTNTRDNLCYMLMGVVLFLCVLILPHMRMSSYAPHGGPSAITTEIGSVRMLRGDDATSAAGGFGTSALSGVSGATETVSSLGAETVSSLGAAPLKPALSKAKPTVSDAPSKAVAVAATAASAPHGGPLAASGASSAAPLRQASVGTGASSAAPLRQASVGTTLSPKRAADSTPQKRLETAAPPTDKGDSSANLRATLGLPGAGKVISKTGPSLK